VKRSLILLVTIAGFILALDWWTKRWATDNLAGRAPVNLVGEFVRFTYTRNSGVAFGLGAGVRFPYYLFSIVAAIVILYLFVRQRVPSLSRQVALALILGGALGNLVDRLKSGEVVDFIEIGWGRWHWPVFNVADSAVTIGVVLFALAWSRRPEDEVPAAEPPARGPNDASLQEGVRPPAEDAIGGERSPERADLDDQNDGSRGARVGHGGAVGSLPRSGTDRPLT
jgi:signal peptidase II